MICKKCANAASGVRAIVDSGMKPHTKDLHPRNCNCPCQHRSGPWEKLFSVERPK